MTKIEFDIEKISNGYILREKDDRTFDPHFETAFVSSLNELYCCMREYCKEFVEFVDEIEEDM